MGLGHGESSCRVDASEAAIVEVELLLQVVNLEGALLRWRGKAPFDPLLHSWHQNAVAELLPTFFRLVDRHDGPATRRCTSRVKDLTFRQTTSCRMDGSDCCFVLIF